MNRTRTIACTALGLAALAAAWAPGTAEAQGSEDWRNLYLDAKPVLDIRYRFEYVDQEGFPNDARANTVRARAGFESGRYYGLGLVFDAEWIEALGSEKFDNTIDGKTQYPVIADPDDAQVNQLHIVSENTIPDTLLKLGRQRIIWDNARFVGSVGFRQNEQTFDAFRGVVTALPDTALEYVYFEEVHRIFGTDSPVGDLGLEGHGIRLQYSGFEPVTITPFALLLDYDAPTPPASDTQSYGVLFEGSRALRDDWRLLYSGSVAYQADYADNPNDVGLYYYRIEPGVAYGGVKLRAGYEVLEGDGASAFQTPLATLHKFNGLTDRFLVTPADGLEDLYATVEAPLPGEGWLSDLTVKAGYHQFWAEKGGSHYGWEWDAGIFKKIAAGPGAIELGLQFAAYDADNFSTDTEKLWLTLQFKLDPRTLRSYRGGGER